jgi:hypothetical protein
MLTPHSPLKCTACDSRRGYAMGLSVVTRAACEVVIPNSRDLRKVPCPLRFACPLAP